MDLSKVCWKCEHGEGLRNGQFCQWEGSPECIDAQREFMRENLKPMPEPATYYEHPESQYPDTVRLSFPDGHTEIYDRRVKQPNPRKYLNMPNRRRRRSG